MDKFIFPILTLLAIIPLLSFAYAESYDINIPTGSADPNAPFHWQSEKDGDATGYIQIIVGDTIVWKNGASGDHTATSGTPKEGPDGLFDSGNIVPGKWFSMTFEEVGKYPYYCTLHPWRTGLVEVVSGFAVLPNVASDIGDGSKTFDLEYKFNRVIRSASVDEDTKSIVLSLQGNTKSEDNTLTILLPSELISGISSVSIDGTETENFAQEVDDDFAKLVIKEISPQAKEISISGATIIPEFGTLALMILGLAIVSTILVTAKSGLVMPPKI